MNYTEGEMGGGSVQVKRTKVVVWEEVGVIELVKDDGQQLRVLM